VWRLFFLATALGVGLLVAAERMHIVGKGETLYQISRYYGVTPQQLVSANPDKLGGGRTLKAGEALRIPGSETPQRAIPVSSSEQDNDGVTPAINDNDAAPVSYTVRRGDTLSSIGRAFKISPSELRELNGLGGNSLRVGQKLRVRSSHNPNTPLPPPPPPASPVKTEKSNSPLVTGGQSASRPAPDHSQRYFFINKVKDKIDRPHVVPGRWKYIVVHHSGTPSGNARIFDYFHRNVRGMENGLAYHFVIGNGHDSGDGEIEVGDRWLRQIQGGHLHSDALNEISIGICFVGDFNSDRPTKKQIAAAIELITYLNERCGKPPVFKAHREINPRPTECPGKNFPVQAFHQLFDR
jgi:LysM repeat protein